MFYKKFVPFAATALFVVVPAFAEQGREGQSQGQTQGQSFEQGDMGQQGDIGGMHGGDMHGSDKGSAGMSGQQQHGQADKSRDYQRGRMGQEQQQSGKLDRDKITKVQEKLKDEVNPNLKVDGKLGKETSQALRDYQQRNQLPASGQPDQQTLSKLGVDNQ